jgi:prepilin-type N-terminal cleavage/methylation domain-containing protein
MDGQSGCLALICQAMKAQLATTCREAVSGMRRAEKAPLAAAQGFSLIELMVVLGIITIMAALLLPVMSKARLQSAAAACMDNQKQLAAALRMYTEDNADRIVQMADYETGREIYPAGGFWGGPQPGPERWANGTEALAAVQAGLRGSNALFFYCNNVGSYHCPADIRITRACSTNDPAGWAYDSYSRTQNLGGEPYLKYWGARATYTKMSAILQPSATFSMIEGADRRGFNRGTWVVFWSVDGFDWEDPPAMSHLRASSVGFADGHATLHKWTDPEIINAGQGAAQGHAVSSWTGATNGADYSFVYNGYLFPGHP